MAFIESRLRHSRNAGSKQSQNDYLNPYEKMFVFLASSMTPSPRAQLWSSQLLVAIGYIEFFRTYSMGDLNVHVIPKYSEAQSFMKP